MNVLHILVGGSIGGIEVLIKNYTSVSKHKNIVLAIYDDGGLFREVSNENVEVIGLNAKTIEFFKIRKKVLALCKEKEVDCVIVHHAAPISHLILLAVKRAYPSIKTIAYAHGNAEDMARVKQRKGLALRRFILSRSLKKADMAIAISESVKNSLMTYFKVPEKQITAIYNAVNVAEFNGSPRTLDTPLRLIYVGRLIQEKGVQNILNALALLPQDNFSFQIVGDGRYRATLENLAKELNLKNVEFLGSRTDVANLLNQANVFLHMPKWEEGFGITIVEAMACCCICVCANKGALPEIITNEKDGFLVEDSPEALAKKLKELPLLTQESLETLQKNARLRAQDFSLDHFAVQLDEAIEK